MNFCLSCISLGDAVKKNIFKSGAVKNNKGAGVWGGRLVIWWQLSVEGEFGTTH